MRQQQNQTDTVATGVSPAPNGFPSPPSPFRPGSMRAGFPPYHLFGSEAYARVFPPGVDGLSKKKSPPGYLGISSLGG